MPRRSPPAHARLCLASAALALTLAQPLVAQERPEPRTAPLSEQAQNRARSKADRSLFESRGQSLSYDLYTPSHTAQTAKLPLVLCLHGRGGSSRANTTLRSPASQAKRPCYVLAPRARKDTVWGQPPERLRGRVELIPLVLQLIDDLVARHAIDTDRIYVTGQSMGGAGTYAALVRRPGLFAAAVPVCGGWDPAVAPKLAHIPMWIFHGGDDRRVPTQRSRDMVAALKAAGSPVRYREYPGVGHNSWNRTYATAELWEWLFEQRRTARAKRRAPSRLY